MSDQSGKHADPSPLKRALFAVKDLTARLDKVERARTEPIAIVGMGCRFPGSASSPSSFWDLLRQGESAIGEVPGDRWDIEAYYDADLDKPGRMYTRQGGFIQGADQFDPRFFGISPREAQSMDPQQRLLLEVAWEALENAAHNPADLAGSSTGVFVGISVSDYGLMLSAGAGHARDLYSGTGNALSIAAGRLSYFLGLNGPALAVDTACSSSLMCVHLAMQSLRNEECAVALAGGVNLMFSPEASVLACRGHMLAPDGRCKTFDADADGYVRGEGCGMVVLKRLRDAVADGDRVLALLRGSAANQDGRSAGLTAPNGAAQEALLRSALRDARIAPGQIGYVEAHGTGTNLGDPIEMRAIQSVYCTDRDPRSPLRVGSVKTNIGHLEPAAGIAGLIKVVSSLVHGAIPASLNFETPNPNIPWDGVPVEIPTRLMEWPRGAEPRCAGVSAFGFSGTNVHVIVQEAPDCAGQAGLADASRLLTLSARTERALRQQAANIEQHLEGQGPEPFADACFTANVGRSRFEHRLALVAASAEEARGKLRRFANGDTAAVATGAAARAPRVAFLYTGQGSQYAGMGRQLFESQPVYHDAIEECDRILGSIGGHRLIDVLYRLDATVADPLLKQTGFAQPALFAVEYALTRLWRAWGVEPAAALGHSVGEYAAACAAGVFSLSDGLTLLAARARLMQSLPTGGGMLAVTAEESQVRALIEESLTPVSIAAINGVEDLVLSGSLTRLRAIDERLQLAGLTTRFLNVSHAFHSTLMQPMLDQFAQVANGLTYRLPTLRLMSNVTGRPVSADEPMDAAYWRRHVMAPVQFGPSLESLRALKYDVFLEIGPHPVLAALGRKADTARTGSWLASLRRAKNDRLQMQETVGELFVRGLDFDARELERPAPRRKVTLPTYPFQRERCWIDAPQGSARDKAPRVASALPGVGVRSALTGDVVFQAEVSASSEAFLADHAVYGNVIFPAAGYVSVALAAADQLAGAGPKEIVDFSLHEAFLFAKEERRLVQTILSPTGDGAYRFGIYSAASTDHPIAPWTRHASGEVRALPQAADESRSAVPSMDEAVARCSTSIDPNAFYAQLEEIGIQYGPSYRRVGALSVGPGEAIGRIAADGTPSSMAVPPAVLDAAFQVLGAAWTQQWSTSGDEVFLPIGIRRLWASGSLPHAGDLRGIARIVDQPEEDRETIAGDVWCFDDRGELMLVVEGFTAKRATREALLRSRPGRTDDWLYEVAWRPAASLGASCATDHWLVFADRSGTGAQLGAALARADAACTMVHAGSAYGEDAGGFTIDPDDRRDYARLLAAVSARTGRAPAGVVHLWNLDLGSVSDAPSDRLLDCGVGSLLHLVQASIEADQARPARMLVVTRGAQAAGGAQVVNPMQAPAWGFARTIAAEHPELGCQIIDLESDTGDAGEADQLFAEIAGAAPFEPQIAYRNGTRVSPRLVRSASPGAAGPIVVPESPYELVIPTRGVLDDLVLAPSTAQPPAAGEVQIRLSASALNFRDVLNALGMYPGDPGPLGSESAGEVVAVGVGVEDLQVGDRVVAIANRAFSTYVCTSATMAQRIPDGLTDEEAVTIPAAYLTAHYGLVRVGQMKAGDRVLIHAAAGGVGLAAVRVAFRAGADVFATAGSPRKRAFLESIGVTHVMDSRSGAFAQHILDATDGAGVDIVLNSLTGDLIDKSLATLAEGGRFVEIGKTDLRDAEVIGRQRPGVSYTVLDLGVECRDDPAGVKSVLTELLSAVQSGDLPALPRQVFPMSAVRDAFRFMAQAKHVGKIVVRHTPAAGVFAPDASYLVTGGAGGLGLEVARWLVDGGARHLILVGRSGASAEAQLAIASLEQVGATITMARADVGSLEQLAEVFARIPQARPLRGIVHAAGCLDDGVVRQLTRERLARVMAPKVQGAWHLHQLSRDAVLDFFVLFSSGAAVFGSPGQANYAAGNAFLDALSQHRRAQHLPGISINWGAWSEVGMAARLESRDRDRISASGVALIDPARGLDALREVLRRDRAQMAVLPIDWTAFARQFRGRVVPAFVAELASAAQRPIATSTVDVPGGDLLLRLVTCEPEGRSHLAQTYVAAQIESVLGLNDTEIDYQQPITTLGLDSLMAVELKNRFEAELGVVVPVVRLLQGPSVRDLAEMLVAGVAADRAEEAAPPIAASVEEGEF